jgi:hypothetical protein
MSLHWTYSAFSKESNLEQGDILKPSEELRTLFAEVHPHFRDPKYSGFLVATQSCDLIRRKGRQAKAQYINLVAIRPLAQVLPKLIFQVVRPIAGTRLLPSNKKTEVHQLLERIFNQNEQSLGLFFLHEDSDSGINEHSVSLLRVAVAVRSDLHYDKLLSARTGRMGEAFQAKLGWLLGNLYSRPAARDWNDFEDDKEKLSQIIERCLGDISPEAGPSWIDDEVLCEAREQGVDLKGKDSKDLEQLRPKPRHERAVDQVRIAVSKVDPDFPEDKMKKVEQRLVNDGKFKKLFRVARS